MKFLKDIRNILRLYGIDRKYIHFSNKDLFDEIYKNSLWGRDSHGISYSGSGSHEPEIIEPYITNVRKFLHEEFPKKCRIVDLGCGDFNVGRNFVDLSSTLTACDVSELIISRNKKNFSNTSFLNIDISKDPLPPGDVAMVRQVLQHLNNVQIKMFVKKLNNLLPYKYLIVTEHIPCGKFIANKDKISGPNIRMRLNSGIVLTEPPFNLKYKTLKTLCEIKEKNSGLDGIIKTVVYEF